MIRAEIAELEKEIENIQIERDNLETRRQSRAAQRAMLINLLEKAKTAAGEPDGE